MMKPELDLVRNHSRVVAAGRHVDRRRSQPDSDLRQVLREHPPDTSIVVIVVYPDSIHELHELKRELYAAGYATADIPFTMGAGDCVRSINAGRSGEYFAQ